MIHFCSSCTGYSQKQIDLFHMHKSYADFGINVNLFSGKNNCDYFDFKILSLLKYIENVDADTILFCDFSDTLCLADETEIYEKYLSFNSPAVFGCESGDIYPSAQDHPILYNLYGDSTTYLNSGLFISCKEYLVYLLNWIISHKQEIEDGGNPCGDQGYYSYFYTKHMDEVSLDSNRNLFVNLCSLDSIRISIKQNRIFIDDKSSPCIAHFNGGSDPLDVMRGSVANPLKYIFNSDLSLKYEK